MFVKNIKDIGLSKVAAGTHTKTHVLIGPDDAPNFSMRRFVIEPGGGIPLHTNEVEHEQYVLSGSAKVGISDETFIVKKDDFVYIPAGVPHFYEVLGSEPFEFICVVPNKEDSISFVSEEG